MGLAGNSIADMKKIIAITPENQPIMVESVHGMGKSEIFPSIFTSQGYRCIFIFVGQAADAGDIIGLPDRVQIPIKGPNGEEIMVGATQFNPPTWWPHDPNEKVAIIWDEANRGKPEINNCIMDMVLNGKLGQFKLPKHTRQFAMINPSGGDWDYAVTPMGKAFLDRWNKYVFAPTADEWIDWAISAKVNKYVMGYIADNKSDLDPPPPLQQKEDQVYPSRRSWKRVSDTMNANPKVDENDTLLDNYMLGVVGVEATSGFMHYIKDSRKKIGAGTIITRWDEDVEARVKELPAQDVTHINNQIRIWFDENTKMMQAMNRGDAAKYTYNLEKYLNVIPGDCMAEFFDLLSQSRKSGKEWPMMIVDLNQRLGDRFVEIITRS